MLCVRPGRRSRDDIFHAAKTTRAPAAIVGAAFSLSWMSNGAWFAVAMQAKRTPPLLLQFRAQPPFFAPRNAVQPLVNTHIFFLSEAAKADLNSQRAK
jgi:hypothetical protein